MNFFTNFIKAHAAGLGGVVMYFLGQWTGLIQGPPVETVNATLLEIVGAVASFGIPWIITALSPKNKPAA